MENIPPPHSGTCSSESEKDSLLFCGIGNSFAYSSSRSESRKRAMLVFLWHRKFPRLFEFAKRISQTSYARFFQTAGND